MNNFQGFLENLPSVDATFSVKSKKDLYQELQQLKQDLKNLDKDSTEYQAIADKVQKIKEKFSPELLEAIDKGITNRDIVLIMPPNTKRDQAVYIPASLKEGLTVVICPLIANIYYHANNIHHEAGIVLAYQGSNKKSTIARLGAQNTSVKMVCTTPESLWQEPLLRRLCEFHSQKKLVRFVVDEAQYIDLHRFRPSFGNLSCLKTYFPDVPISTFMSDCSVATKSKVLTTLRIRETEITQSVYKISARHEVIEGTEDDIYLNIKNYIISNSNKQGILYCISKEKVLMMSKELKDDLGYPVKCYHSGLDNKERQEILNDFAKGTTKLIVATKSFIAKKANVNFVFWCQLPFQFGDYTETSTYVINNGGGICRIYYAPEDEDNNTFVIENDDNSVKQDTSELKGVVKYCQDKHICRHKLILKHWGKKADFDGCQTKCDNCQPTPSA
ncbi:P-loop containing nucleoside triphosphate hydrolase protein [Blakeslea trispora]|nr:P-loop containing nucleoside triphosphate hydrolase protein [Blakeslea trispora]